MSNKRWLVPLTGLVFIVLLIVGFIVMGEPPDAEDPVQEIVDFYQDDKDSIEAGVFLLALGTVFFVFFANYLRTVFRETSNRRASSRLGGSASPGRSRPSRIASRIWR